MYNIVNDIFPPPLSLLLFTPSLLHMYRLAAVVDALLGMVNIDFSFSSLLLCLVHGFH
jgi:hypothetical protein